MFLGSSALRAALVAGDHDAVLAALTTLPALATRVRSSLDGLLADLAQVLREAPTPLPAGPGRELLIRLETVLDARRDELTRDPAQLFPILYRALHWTALSGWVERERVGFEAQTAWLRPLRPPRISDAALPAWRMPGDARDLDRDGVHLLLELGDQLHLIAVATGATLKTFPKTRGRIAPEGDRLVLHRGSTAELWSITPLARITELGPYAGRVEQAIIVGRRVIVHACAELRAYRVSDGHLVATRPLEHPARALLACGDRVLIHFGRAWQLWDPAADRWLGVSMPGDYDTFTAVSPAGDRLVTYAGGSLMAWTLPEGRPLLRRAGEGSSMAFHPDGARFATRDGRLLDVNTCKVTATLPLRSVSDVAFDPTGRFLLAVDESGGELWDLATSTAVARVRSGRHGAHRIHWSRDGGLLVLGDWDSAAIVDLTALSPAAPQPDDARPVRCAWLTRFAPGGATMVSEHVGGVAVWDTRSATIRAFIELKDLLTFFDQGRRALGRRGDQLIAFASADGAELWTITRPGRYPEEAHPIDAHGMLLYGLHPDGPVIAIDAADGSERYRLEATRLMRHDRDIFVTRDEAGDVSVRAVQTGAELVALSGIRGGGSYHISPDHRWLAVHDGSVALWDLTTRTLHRTIPAYPSSNVDFRADSNAVILTHAQSQQSGNQDWNTEDIYDIVTGACLGSKGWWDQDDPSEPPLELAPGLVRPADAIVCAAADGATYVALTQRNRIELFVVAGATTAPR